MCSGVDGNLCLPVDGGDFGKTTQSGCGDVEQQAVDEVVLVAYKGGVLLLLDQYQQVARYAVVLARVSFAAHRELHALVHACGYVHLNNLLAHYNAVAVAVVALVLDDLSLTVAVRAGNFGLHHAKETLLCAHHAACSFTFGAGLYGAVLCSAAVTVGAGYIFLQLELLCDTVCNLLQRELHLHSLVAAAESCGAAAATTATEAAETAKASTAAEYVTEH